MLMMLSSQLVSRNSCNYDKYWIKHITRCDTFQNIVHVSRLMDHCRHPHIKRCLLLLHRRRRNGLSVSGSIVFAILWCCCNNVSLNFSLEHRARLASKIFADPSVGSLPLNPVQSPVSTPVPTEVNVRRRGGRRLALAREMAILKEYIVCTPVGSERTRAELELRELKYKQQNFVRQSRRKAKAKCNN